MQVARTRTAVFLAALTTLLLAVASAFALQPGPDGWYFTGKGTRVKTVLLVDVNVYEVSHSMKKLPETKSKRAVIELDADKKITWTMLRDVDAEKIHNALKDGFKLNGYSDQAKISKFLRAFSGELKEKSRVTIQYNAETKATSVSIAGGGSATVEGADFMKGVWSLWFGQIDQPELGDAMISKL